MASALRITEVRSPAAGLDFTGRMWAICADMAARLPELAHVDMRRVAVTYALARKRVSHGLYATLTPLRFEGGARIWRRRGRSYTLQRVIDVERGVEVLYIVRFYLPRFLNASLLDKLATTVHELWHISPAFDGDARRYPGRCHTHSRSLADFDAEMLELARRWLDLEPPPELYEFLRDDFRRLTRRHGAIWGLKLPHPKMLPLC